MNENASSAVVEALASIRPTSILSLPWVKGWAVSNVDEVESLTAW